MVDLHFTYRDEPAKLCCELKNLKEDEIAALLEALKQRFDAVEQGAFSFSIKQEEDYSPLELALRQRNGEWMDSGIDEALQVMMKLNIKVDHDFNDDQQRWLDVRHTAEDFKCEIDQLREELCAKPSSIFITHSPQESILKHVPHDKLLEHLAKTDPSVKRQKQREEVAEAVLVESEKRPTDTQAEKGHDELLEPLAKIDPVAKRPQGGQEAVEVETPGGSEKEPNAVEDEGKGDEEEEQAPALKKVQLLTLKILATFDPQTLATADDVANEMPVSERLSTRTIQPAIHRLVTLGLAERPEGSRQGARVTMEGRRFASRISV